MEDERTKFLTFRTVRWTGESKAFTNRGVNVHCLPSLEPRTGRTRMEEWLGQEEEEGDKRA
jgi:hypothetical protein